MQYEGLALSSNQSLEAIFRAAVSPDPKVLVGFEWRGSNISAFTQVLGIRKFIKGFFLQDQCIEGYNIPVAQNGLNEQWIARPNSAHPRRYAFYTVTRVDSSSKDNYYPRALLLNYGASRRNPPFGLERLLRDYLVQVDALNPDLLLGKAYLALGPWRLFSNFFVIERLGPTGWRPGAV